ncbi:unnamed protein product [Aspergillus oryzae RIB40]|uniref:DNA, SC113 n=1 Tax=Aspergillus oryzae (strain ATCC 42149 / RIB 40) TaxID=510516 RepID=Q2U5P4_ASPOR|nr:unnamed protein product [Aspergillus oryzae RIB40]BAE63121.1 unnamed protein product [Aspergillus oryzae RIB40]
MVGLSVTSLLTAVESTVTSTALPTISRDLHAGVYNIWFASAVFLLRLVPASPSSFTDRITMALSAPRFNRFTDSLPTFLVNDGPAVALPASGSGISGGASSSRKRQSAGQYCLLLPYYFAPTSASDSAYLHSVSVSSSIGPFIGGALTQHVT